MANPKRALIVGGGIAGPVASYWLAKGGWNVLMVDRSKDRSFLGQGIDLTGPAVDVVKRMGLLDTIKARCTNEGGFAMCNDDGTPFAALGVSGTEKNKGTTLTQEIEIMRGDLADVFHSAIETMPGKVEVRYGCSVSEIRQTSDKVSVVLTDTEKVEDFDVVIGADGVRSAVRELTFDPKLKADCKYTLDIYCAFFSVKAQEGDYPNAKWQNSIGGRSVLIRPVSDTRTSVYFVKADKSPELAEAIGSPAQQQKAAVQKAFKGFPGLGARAAEELKTTDNFYLDRLTQIHLPTWHSGRCALIGDAAYCPTPLTGKGTSLAVTGAYMLAGELSDTPDDPIGAFERYHEKMKDHAKSLQTIAFNGYAPRMLNPTTWWGIAILRSIFRFVAWSGVWKLGDIMEGKAKFHVPEYSNSK